MTPLLHSPSFSSKSDINFHQEPFESQDEVKNKEDLQLNSKDIAQKSLGVYSREHFLQRFDSGNPTKDEVQSNIEDTSAFEKSIQDSLTNLSSGSKKLSAEHLEMESRHSIARQRRHEQTNSNSGRFDKLIAVQQQIASIALSVEQLNSALASCQKTISALIQGKP